MNNRLIDRWGKKLLYYISKRPTAYVVGIEISIMTLIMTLKF